MENVFATFLLNSGLYDTIDVTEENIEELDARAIITNEIVTTTH